MEFLPSVQERKAIDQIKLACLRVGPAFYALDIMGIREIIRPIPLIEVPRAPTYVDGVINLRNSVIPVVDMRRRFGLARKSEPRERIVICAIDGRIVGLLVDEVSEVATFARDEIRPAPYYMCGADNEFFPGVCRHRGRLLLLIDLRKILSTEQRIDADLLQQQVLENETED